jgi:glycosyltransferase involved in cell wall biosynthesis
MNSCLIVCSSFYPAFKSGGPVRSLTNLVRLLGNKTQFDIITADRDLGDISSFSSVELNSWSNTYFSSRIFYIQSCLSAIIGRTVTFEKKYEVMYLNSFFDIKFSLLFLILWKIGVIDADRVILAPRGELTDGAISLKKQKKLVFIYLFKLLGFKNNITFHFTSEDEKKQATKYLGDINSILIPNMHEKIPHHIYKIKKIGELKILFLARVSPKKNLKTIIKTLSNVTSGNIELRIAGEMEDKNYVKNCLNLIAALPENITVSFLGAIERERVKEELVRSHLFFLPTLNENYGHSIVEAMINSNAVLLSDQTPWNNVSNCGGFVSTPFDVEYFVSKLNYLVSVDEKDFNQITHSIYNYCLHQLSANEKLILDMFD